MSAEEALPDTPVRRRRRPLRTTFVVLAALSVAGLGGVAASGALGGEGEDPAAAAPSGPAKTAKVERSTLTRNETVDGTLGYGEQSTVRAAAKGTVTWLPEEGEILKRGEAVYSIDERKVPLLYGATPVYRPLGVGDEGKDVGQLEKNLAALGYTGFTVDDSFSEGTADAVRAWQEDLGGKETGSVRPGDAVIAAGTRRVAELKAEVGGPPAGGEVLSWTDTERLITVDLDVRYEDLVKEGSKAMVELPNGTSVEAKVSEVGAAATPAPSAQGGGDSEEETTLPVQLEVKEQKELGRYQAAPVEVSLEAETREDVLAVPVSALVAVKEGGYAVQAADGEYLPVELGMFAGGLVEVSGSGIREGLAVGVPK